MLSAVAIAAALVGFSPSVVGAAPNFHLFDQQGRMVSLNEFAGRPVVLFFWASWSGPVDSVLASFQAHGRGNVVLLAIDESVTEEAPQSVRERVQAMHLGIPVLFDDLGEAAETLEIRALPGIVALDASHEVVYRKVNGVTLEDMAAAVRAASGLRALRTDPARASPHLS